MLQVEKIYQKVVLKENLAENEFDYDKVDIRVLWKLIRAICDICEGRGLMSHIYKSIIKFYDILKLGTKEGKFDEESKKEEGLSREQECWRDFTICLIGLTETYFRIFFLDKQTRVDCDLTNDIQSHLDPKNLS